jgi:hypothetical protein
LVIKELSLPKEPAPVKPVEPKPSKSDTAEEPARTEFPVTADEKAEDVSPSTKTEKTEAKATEIPSEANVQKTRAETLKEARTISTNTGTTPAAKARGNKVSVKDSKKSDKKTGPITVARQTGESSAHNGMNKTIDGSQGDSSKSDTGKGEKAGIILPEPEKAKEQPQKKPPLGVAVSDALFYRDIKIEVFLKQSDTPNIHAKLYKKTHPSVDDYSRPEQKSVDLTADAATEGKVIFSVAKAEKGIYTFVMQNTSDNLQKTSLMIRLLEGKKGARNRKFETINIDPHAGLTVKFLLPEGIFWDDETYFSGSIESSDSITKYNDATGIVWKEQKE